ncbi:MAG: 2-oxoacid:acceptor oxidoreductase subunit alpha [Armatimonadota bacterium]
MDLNIRIAGEAGQGVQTAGDLLVEAFASIHLHLLSTQSYMSRIRGGLNWYDIRISDQELWSGCEQCDLLVALTADALDELRPQVPEGGLILFDGEAQNGIIEMHFDDIAKEVSGNAIMANAVAAGAVFALLGYDVQHLVDYLRLVFAKKGQDIIDQNAACARRGAELVAAHVGRLQAPQGTDGPAYVIDGASAFGMGACVAGVKFVSSYPMSPSTGVLNYMAAMTEKYNVLAEQAEDEISALNMVCGATYAGVPAMTTTSGGGFSLMVEALSLAGMHELPVLLFLGMRPGPATGLPTRTGQEDLRFCISAGHGEFPRAIYAPGTLQQTYDMARQALQTAHKYQTPAIVLMDQFLIDMHRNMPALDDTYAPIDRMIETTAGAEYGRYAITPSGVSPRAIPGGEAFVVCDSDEHDEGGHLTEDLNVRLAMVDKRLRKGENMCRETLPPSLYGPEDAETLLICWGSTYGPCREGVDLLNSQGQSVAMAHFVQVWPLQAETAREVIGQRKRVICVEGNARGQFASVLREIGAIGPCELLTRYDGMPFTGLEIARRVSR